VEAEVAAEDVEEENDATAAAVVDGMTLNPLTFMPNTVNGAGAHGCAGCEPATGI